MKKLMIALVLMTACSPVSEPERAQWDYTRRTTSGETVVTGTLVFTVPSVGRNFVGHWQADGRSGDLRGAYVGRELQFLVFTDDDTLRHVAVNGDTLTGHWHEGTVTDRTWQNGDRGGTFTAIRH